MADSGLLNSFYFSVWVGHASGGTDAVFQEVSSLSEELAAEEVAGGGENRFEDKRPAQASNPNLVLKRGVMQADSPLAQWCRSTLDGNLGKPAKTRNVTVSLIDAQGHLYKSWTFFRVYPVSWKISELNSQEGGVPVETIELAYDYRDMDAGRDSA